jgi:hypothetical protein
MNRFVIVDGLPYLLAHGKTYSVRMGEIGFKVGAEVEMASVPARTFSELSVRAKCAGHLDSISAPGATQDKAENEGQKANLDSMSVKELKTYAEAHGIDLNGLTKKADILNAIKAVNAE